jgi:diguanylate cyclase (GGDEF)-like protein
MLWAAVAFLLGYTVVGFAGIALQSAQTGVTPVWPASGIAFGLCYWFGIRYAVLIIPAMLGLAWALGVPLSVAWLAGLGSMLEAGVAVWLMRRFKVDPSLSALRDTLLFVGLAAVVGPLFSAGLGSLAMALLTDNPIPPLYIGMMWWLGNSLGVLLIGGLVLVTPVRRYLPRSSREWIELAALGALMLVVTWFAIHWVEQVSSALVLYLLVPSLVIAALRIGQFGVLLMGSLVLVMLLVASGLLPHGSLGKQGLGILYLDITLLWVASFTGLIVGSARQEREQREEVSWLATHDPLTDMVNQHEFMLRLDRVLRVAREQRSHHAVIYIDLDRFRRINDAEGHAAGDQVLRDVAIMLDVEVRRRDSVARIGGDEFALLLESCPLVEACGIAENIRRALEAYSYHGGHADYAVEASVGVVEVSENSVDSGTVLDQAERACNEAKRAGRNRVWVGLGEDDAG